MERCWLIHIPSGYDEAQKHPLIVNLHGFGGNKNALYNYSHFDVIAEENNVIVTRVHNYPQWPDAVSSACTGSLAVL